MNRNFKFIVLVAIAAMLCDEISGHGYLWDPVNRASRWRVDGSNPKDYNDMETNCGGYGYQWSQQGGKCGHCGDQYGEATPRLHELGGMFGKGVIMKTYKSGATIEVTVKITANHRGYFYFNICNLDTGSENDACFERYRLLTSSGADTYPLPSTSAGTFSVSLKLPAGLTCNHCVMQWTYVAGNNWGSCGDGTGKLGCGPQEHFRSCSDIQITK